MGITLRTHKMLWGRAGNRCALCRRELVIDATETDDESVIGQECHIVAEKPDGPRGESPLTLEERSKYANLILMCGPHHKQIDDQVNTYPVERLQNIKRDHETWVRTQLGMDQRALHEEEVAAGYVEEWAERVRLDEWKFWVSSLLSHGQPSISKARLHALDDIRPWIIARLWPVRHGPLRSAFLNFGRVAGDLVDLFEEHVEVSSGDRLYTRKFYQIDHWDEELYATLTKRFDDHVDLVQDLALELTRAANRICEEVRAHLSRGYRVREGAVLVEAGPFSDLTYRTFRAEYTTAEQVPAPYPGLADFRDHVRFTRDACFGKKSPALPAPP